MTRTADKLTYGLLIEASNRYGTSYVTARMVCRRNDGEHPSGCRGEGEDSAIWQAPAHMDGLALDGLRIEGHVSDNPEWDLVGCDTPHYRDIYSTDLRLSKKQTKTLQKIVTRLERDKAREPGDVFLSLSKALKLDFAVNQRADGARDRWNWMTVEEGRNYFRELIRTQVEAKHGKRAAGVTP